MQGDMHKVNAGHLKRSAYLYIRQSTPRQVLENTESTKRQYALRQRAIALGWHPDRIVVIDGDLGQSGSSAADREGFQKLVGEVGMGHAGLVIGLEVSRLARNCSDWHRLLEICGFSDTLILDEDGVYDPAHFNDRLLLGLNRPDTQCTSYSTFHATTSIGTISQPRSRTWLAFGQSVPTADIPDVLGGETTTKGTAQTGTIERCRDF
jgi:Resolvase, N terminal domain